MIPPFDKDFTGDMFDDYGFDPVEMANRKELAGLMIEDFFRNKDEKVVAPDTTGVDYFFLQEFINGSMEQDFAEIEQDFLNKCRAKLQEFNEAGIYFATEYRTRKPLECMHKKIMMLIYSGAKLGDEYCVELIKYLYKTYHKKEYNSLKRFHKITTQEIFGLAEDEYEEYDLPVIGRIMGMCPFMHIEYDPNCSIMFKLLLKRRDEWMSDEEDSCEYMDWDHDLFVSCKEQVDAWIDEKKKEKIPFEKMHAKYWEQNEFVGACLRNRGYAEDYVYLCMENNMGLSIQLARTLAILKTMHPNREYTFEEVEQYTNMYDLVSSMTDIAECVEYEIGYLTGDKVEEFDDEDTWFHPEAITVRNAPRKEEKKSLTNVAPVSNGKVSDDDYLKEIAELRKKLHEQEQENKYLRDQYRSAKNSFEEVNGLLKKYEEERDELIALREFAYKSEHGSDPVEEDKIPDMKAAIADKNIVILGGHVAWQNKLKTLFPNWMFVSPDAYKTVDGKMLENKDMVYFYTDYINHISYKKFITAVRERKIPFGYLGSNNVDNVVNQIYSDMVK